MNFGYEIIYVSFKILISKYVHWFIQSYNHNANKEQYWLFVREERMTIKNMGMYSC